MPDTQEASTPCQLVDARRKCQIAVVTGSWVMHRRQAGWHPKLVSRSTMQSCTAVMAVSSPQTPLPAIQALPRTGPWFWNWGRALPEGLPATLTWLC